MTDTVGSGVRELMEPAWSRAARTVPPGGTISDPDYEPGGAWPWDWANISGDQARRMWSRLEVFVAFLNDRYGWDSAQLVPPCWAFHGGMVEELTTLYWSRWAAFTGPDSSPERAQNWHTYHLAGFHSRLGSWCGGPQNLTQCQTGNHVPARRPAARAGAGEQWRAATIELARLDHDLRPCETEGFAGGVHPSSKNPPSPAPPKPDTAQARRADAAEPPRQAWASAGPSPLRPGPAPGPDRGGDGGAA